MIIFVLFFVIVACFGIVLLFGAPYLPSHRKQINQGLDLLKIKPGEVVYEFGCGDGYVLRLLAKRGAKAIGYELNPLLFVVAWLACLKYGSAVKVRLGNFWKADISEADIVYVFLLDRFMKRLDQKLVREAKKGTRLLSYTFQIPGKKASAKTGGMYLYKY